MNSRKTNLRLIENIKVHVPNTVSISKGILFHVSKFLEKMIFQLMFEIFMTIRQHVLKDFLFESLFNNAAGLKVCNFIRKRLHHRCFLVVNIAKFLRTAFV